MKKIVFLLLLPTITFGQEIDVDTLQFVYTGVETVDSVAGKTLQSRAKLFIAENFKSAKDVLQLDDAEAGVIAKAKGNIIPVIKILILGHEAYGYVNFTCKIQVKDGKYKYTFSDFVHQGSGDIHAGGPLTNKRPVCGIFLMSEGYWRQVQDYTNKDVIAFINQLKSKMRSSEINPKKDDF